MTREEAARVIENMTFMCDDTDYDVMRDAVNMAIEALKERNNADSLVRRSDSEPKESKRELDLISRQAAVEAADRAMTKEVAIDSIKALPSLTPIEKTGGWIDIDNYYRLATCSHCDKVTMFEKWGEYTKPYEYCPNCGAKMANAKAVRMNADR